MSEQPYDAIIAYLESDGNQWIDTNYILSDNQRNKLYIECASTNNSGTYKWIFGSKGGTKQSVFAFANSNGSLYTEIKGSNWASTDYKFTLDSKNAIELNSTSIVFNGSPYSHGGSFVYSGVPITIFGCKTSTGFYDNKFIGRVYAAKIYDNDTLVRDFIPVRVGQEGCLYDKVSGEIFRNAGTGSFILGSPLMYHSPLISNIRRRLLYAKPKELPNYLCFTALESGTFTLTFGNTCGTAQISYVEYSLDGNTWVKTNNVNNTQVIVTTPTLNAGDKVYWRGSGIRNSVVRDLDTNRKGIFSSTCKFDISGNIASYLFGKNYQNVALAYRAFVGLFMNCTNLVNAQDLVIDPVTTTYDDFAYLFYGCTSLLTSPDLSNIPINEYIFAGMFQGCTSLVATSELPQTALMRNCYSEMYRGCTALTSANSIPARNFPIQACTSMYYGCTSLISTAAMIVDDAALSAFANMYQGCTLLTDAENITINSFTGNTICQNMFRQCSSLVDKIPTINSSSITNGCFTYMYYQCSNLTKAHSFPALTLLPTCYSFMYHSTKVNYAKMYATDISATNCLTNWLYAVPNNSSCIFVKNINAQWTDTGWSAVPTKWTIIYYDPELDKYYLDQQRNEECDEYGNYKAVEATTNPEAMAVIYAQGWSASPDYMTFSEASAVTDIGTYFRNAGLTHFMEFIRFTGVTTIKTNAFSGNNSLVSLCIPRNVTTIQNFGIVGGPLEYLYIPSSVTTIVGSANFSNTSNVRFELHVDDLDSYVMLDIGQQLFKGTTNNPDYYFYEGEKLLNSAVVLETATKIGSYTFAGYNKISSITIPNSVLTIGNNAFYNARYGFTNFIDIGSGVTSIGNQAFADVRSCPTLICRAMTAPTLGTNVFTYWGYNIPTAERKLIVPVGAVGYDTDQWKTVLQDQRGYQLIYSDEL